jgi:hypothetical protein
MFRITTSGVRELSLRYALMSDRMKYEVKRWLRSDGRQLLDEITDKRFRDQSDGYRKWAPLAESTTRQRARLGFPPSKPILVRTEDLRNSLMGKSNKTFHETTFTMSVGARLNSPKAYRLHYGNPSKNTPPRKILNMTKKDGAMIAEEFHKFFSKEILTGKILSR